MIRENQWKHLDNYKRKLFLKNELKKIILTSILLNQKLPQTYKYFALYNRSKLIRISSVVQQKNRCVLTGRRWSINKFTKYSRFVFRTESYKGHLPGFKRASW